MSPPIKKIEGSAGPALAVGLVALVVLVIVIAVFNRVIHTAQEEAAYRFMSKEKESTQLKSLCDDNVKTFEALKIWVQQQNLKVKPNPEILVAKPCLVKRED